MIGSFPSSCSCSYSYPPDHKQEFGFLKRGSCPVTIGMSVFPGRHTCLRHSADHQMMERADGVEINRPCPMLVIDNGHHMKALAIFPDRFCHHSQECAQMFFLRGFRNPVFIRFCLAKNEKGGRFPGFKRHILGLQRREHIYILLPHPQKADKKPPESDKARSPIEDSKTASKQ